MPLTLRVDYQPPSVLRDAPHHLVAKNAAHALVDLASTFPDQIPTIVEVVASVLGHDMYAHPASVMKDVLDRWQGDHEKARASAYVCGHCRVSSPKELWGPGRITCPKCGRMADAADGTPRP
jgi:hypothetical protein